jgi:anti-sigma B factor antagonist
LPEGICPVQWAGSQAVVTLPEEIDISNTNQVREQLLVLINRGAAVLVADLSATVACDYSGTDALLRAYGRAVLNGTEFRLVAGSNIVRRMLTLSGLDRLVPVYPSLEGATAADGRHQVQEALSPGDLLDSVLNSIFQVSMILQAAAGLSPDLTTERIDEALRRLDEVVRMVRDHLFDEPEQGGGATP